MITFDFQIQLNIMVAGYQVIGPIDVLFHQAKQAGEYIFEEVRHFGLTMRESGGKIVPISPEVLAEISNTLEDMFVDGYWDYDAEQAIQRYFEGVRKCRS